MAYLHNGAFPVHLRVDRAKFVESFAAAAQVAPQRTPKPILQNVKIVARPNEVRLYATDMEFSLAIDADGAEAFHPGQCLLPAARMLSILREMREEVVDITVEGTSAVVKGGKSKFQFQTENPDLFPSLPELPEELPLLTLPASRFRGLLRRTMFATDPDSATFAVGGIFFETSGSYLHAVATDGGRMAHVGITVLEAENFHGFDTTTIVPQHSCQMLDKLVGDDGNVSIGVSVNDFVVKSDSATIRTRLMEGRFPKWRTIVPDRSQMQCASIGREALLSAVRQTSIVATPQNRGVDFTFAPGTVKTSAKSVEYGASEAETGCVSDIDDLSITFDFRFMLDFLKATDADSVDIYVANEEKAALLVGDEGYEYVAMPLAQERVAEARNTAAEPKRKAG